ncbi:hypothetical protein BDP27DRAFT_1324830 [Rhodocollybia butyracea]|uniref:Uncharacterized protein n=1 Tax=Rhodocollybia butyracea TaxID=206335 RepID=A0A9P5U9E3_9AGAR|nr:hypothetical protein BDP27DRAFT_1324830 [Rhodocollybia butyracea]
MAVNDRTQGGAVGVDTYPGVANPTSSSDTSNPLVNNFVADPTTAERGAGAGPNFDGDKQAARNFKETAGVIEGRPGIIETSNIDPLNHDPNKDDWANTKQPQAARTTEGFVSTATTKVSEAANKAYEKATGQK